MYFLQKNGIVLAFSFLILKPPTQFNVNKGSALIELNKANTSYLRDNRLREYEVYINKYGGYIIFLNHDHYIAVPSCEALEDYLPKKGVEHIESNLLPLLSLD